MDDGPILPVFVRVNRISPSEAGGGSKGGGSAEGTWAGVDGFY